MNNCCKCDENKVGCPWQVALWILAVLGVIAGIIGIAYTVYRFCSRVFSNTTVQKHQFFGTQPSSQSNSHIHT